MADYRNKPLQLGTYHMVSTTSSMYEPQRTNNFELQIVGLGGLKMFTDKNSSGIGKSVPNNISDQLTLSIANFTAPTIEMSNITIPYSNNEVHFAGKPTFSGANRVTFNDYIGLNVERLLMAWFKEVYNVKTQAVGRAKNYKKTAYVIEYDPSGTYSRSWQLNGLWISSIELGEYSQDDNSVRKINCAFVYDNCLPLDNDEVYN